MFKLENVNPKGKKTTDCVIRAIAKAENKSWLEIFDTLTEIARKKYSVLNDSEVYGKYLEKYETINVMHMVGGSKKRYTVEEVSKEFKRGAYVISIAGHLTTVIDGNIYDIWDCGQKSTYKIWKIK